MVFSLFVVRLPYPNVENIPLTPIDHPSRLKGDGAIDGRARGEATRGQCRDDAAGCGSK